MSSWRSLPLGELAPHVATLLRQLDPAARLRLVRGIREEAIKVALPLVSRLVEAERADLRAEAAEWERERPDYAAARLRMADAVRMPDLTVAAAVAAVSAGYGPNAQRSIWKHAVEVWKHAPPAERSALDLIACCTNILDQQQIDDHSRDLLLRCLDALHPDRRVGASVRAGVAKGGRSRRETSDHIDGEVERIARDKLSTGSATMRELAGIIAPLVKRTPEQVRNRLAVLGIKPKKKQKRS